MLPALGQLNSDLLTAYYADKPASSKHVSNMLKHAQSLHRRARSDLKSARAQEQLRDEEVAFVHQANVAKHISDHTVHANTMCTGPCVHIPRQHVQAVARASAQLETDRVRAVRDLTHLLMDMPRGSGLDPTLCRSTGLVCAVLGFDHPEPPPVSSRLKRASMILKEAETTSSFATTVANSQVRELEACSRYLTRLDLTGGGDELPLTSTNESVRDFFNANHLGVPPDTDSIRIAIHHVGSQIAPRSRQVVTTDLWSRWLNL